MMQGVSVILNPGFLCKGSIHQQIVLKFKE